MSALRTLALLGPQGTHSAELAERAFPVLPRIEHPTISDCLQAVADLQVSAALVPLENSLEGSVNSTLDRLAEDNRLFITQEFIWPIRHYLLMKAGAPEPHTILSHPQALAQCRNYLRTTLPSARLQPCDSTAAAAAAIAQSSDCGIAAIAGLSCAKLYSLRASGESICDAQDNHTRFVLIEPTLSLPPHQPAKTSLVCRMQGNTPGSLHLLLEQFAQRGINLTRIESRPARTRLGEYSFFLDLDGALHDAPIAAALREIRTLCSHLAVFGCYSSVQY